MPESAETLRALFERLDPAFTAVWWTHLSRLMTRPQLDVRTRFLVLTGQYSATGKLAQLEETIAAGLKAGVPSAEMTSVSGTRKTRP